MAHELRVFSSKDYENPSLTAAAAAAGMNLVELDVRLGVATADLAADAEAISVFVNDDVARAVVEKLAEHGVKCIALRCAGTRQRRMSRPYFLCHSPNWPAPTR